MNIAEKLQTLIQVKSDIKEALIAKGCNVGDDITQWANAVGDMSTGGGDVDYSNYPKVQSTNYIYTAKDGTVYVSSSTSSTGLYMIKDNIATQVMTTGYGWRVGLETSNGDIFIYSNNSAYPGLYVIKNGNRTATRILSTGYTWSYNYEAKNGYIYFTNNDSSGIWAYDGNTMTKIISYGRRFVYPLEASNGKIYASNGYDSGVYVISNKSCTRITNTDGCENIFEASNGTIYATSTASYRFHVINNTTLVSTILTDKYFGTVKHIETSNGNIYLSQNSNKNNTNFITGIYEFSNNTFTQVVTTGYWETYNNIFIDTTNKKAYDPELGQYVDYPVIPEPVTEPYYVINVVKVTP